MDQTKMEAYMRLSLSLAQHGRGHTAPNPMVGAILVRDGKIIGQGFHERFGGNHAEVNAIRAAEQNGFDVGGSILFVTLEPCAHHGKTPPCSELIIEKGIEKVIIANPDPNPQAAGGIEKLRNAGVLVETGLLAESATELNRIFLHFHQQQRPYFIVKVAISNDGMVTAETGKRTQISGKDAQLFTHRLRQQCDAIMVGSNTVNIDNPLLTVRHGEQKTNPLRIIIDPSEKVQKDADVFQDQDYLILTNETSYKNASTKNVAHIAPDRAGELPPAAICRILTERTIRSVMIEGGPRTISHFLKAGLIDEMILIRSKQKVFQTGVKLFEDKFPAWFELHKKNELKDDVIEIYRPNVV